MSTEQTPLLSSLEDGEDTIFDPSTEVPGFVASQLDHHLEHPRHQHEQPEQLTTLSQTRVNIIIVSMFLGVFLAALDSTIVTTIVGHIASEFDALPRLSWIATSYLVSSATFQPLYGKLSDIFGRRALLLFCNIMFSIGCIFCWLAPSVEWLIFGRFISGAGGGGLSSLTSITTSDIVPLKSRGIYQGLINIGYALGAGFGGFLGGVCSDTLGWRLAFFIQVPISLLSAFCIYWFLILPKSIDDNKSTDIFQKLGLIDWYGSFSLIAFLLLFLTSASIGGKEIAFTSLFFILLVLLTIISFTVFVVIELKVSKNPIIPLRFMSIPTVTGVSLTNFFACVSSYATYFILPIYFTAVMNLNPTEIGKRFAPNFFSVIFGSLGAGIYIKKTGRYKPLLVFAGLIAIFGRWRIVTLNPRYTVFEQYILTVTPDIGVAIILTATLLALIAAVPHEHQAATTSISYLFRSIGCTLGVSIGSAIFAQKLSYELNLNVLGFLEKGYDLKTLQDVIFKAEHSSEYVQNGAPAFIKNALLISYEHASKLAFEFCFITAILGFITLFLIKEYDL